MPSSRQLAQGIIGERQDTGPDLQGPRLPTVERVSDGGEHAGKGIRFSAKHCRPGIALEPISAWPSVARLLCSVGTPPESPRGLSPDLSPRSCCAAVLEELRCRSGPSGCCTGAAASAVLLSEYCSGPNAVLSASRVVLRSYFKFARRQIR